ncbi:MAG: phosphatidate cytidylyltransferase [Syntrophales bacterium]|jgi:phosphatidate cytidylyltransferase|nr:phosphatidate cytidylyltransferase [Syntrophales bacterium]
MNAFHIQRWLTAFIAVPSLFLLIYFGNEAVFSFLIALVIFFAAWEYEKIIHGSEPLKRRWEFFCIVLVIPLMTHYGGLEHLYAVLSLLIICLILCDLFRIRNRKEGPDISLLTKYLFGIWYIPVFISYFILIRRFENGVLWIFFILILAFSGDVAAFYSGKFLGKTKLMPSVSPNKTVAGVIGLVAGSMAACLVFACLFMPNLWLPHVLAMSFLGGVTGQLGDLFESEIKRTGGVKDSGTALPGHGGILDRMDCLLFIAPVIYYYKTYIIN